KLLLRRAAPKYAGPNFNLQQTLGVDIDEAFGTGPDWIALRNATGSDLHNALVSVTLLGKAGDTKENIHFIPHWRAGETIHGRYETGTLVGDKAIGRQTVSSIQSARIHLTSDEGRQENITYQYAGPEKDKDVQRNLNELTHLYARYRPFAKGIVWND